MSTMCFNWSRSHLLQRRVNEATKYDRRVPSNTKQQQNVTIDGQTSLSNLAQYDAAAPAQIHLCMLEAVHGLIV